MLAILVPVSYKPVSSFIISMYQNVNKCKQQTFSHSPDIKYPFLGIQFHPEKPVFEWANTLNIPHNQDAIFFSQFLANMWVREVKHNDKPIWKNPADEQRYLMMKDPMMYMGFLQNSHSPFMQIYIYGEQPEETQPEQ